MLAGVVSPMAPAAFCNFSLILLTLSGLCEIVDKTERVCSLDFIQAAVGYRFAFFYSADNFHRPPVFFLFCFFFFRSASSEWLWKELFRGYLPIMSGWQMAPQFPSKIVAMLREIEIGRVQFRSDAGDIEIGRVQFR